MGNLTNLQCTWLPYINNNNKIIQTLNKKLENTYELSEEEEIRWMLSFKIGWNYTLSPIIEKLCTKLLSHKDDTKIHEVYISWFLCSLVSTRLPSQFSSEG